jgi:hypothetical protein
MAQFEQSPSTILYGGSLEVLLRQGNERLSVLGRCVVSQAPAPAEQPIRHDLVARLRQQIAAGTYNPDPMQIAQAMFASSRRLDSAIYH